MRALIDLVAPVRCVSCGCESDADLCAPCAWQVEVMRPPLCGRCGGFLPLPGRCRACDGLRGFARARSLVVYGGRGAASGRLVLALKRRGRAPLARHMGALLGRLARAEALSGRTVTFVPAGPRASSSGFDHAELLARGVARELRLPLVRPLRRVGSRARQSEAPARSRRQNAAGAFRSEPLSGPVLLVDDVFTTGATAEACALALLDAGAGPVDVVTWARTLRRGAP